MMFVQYTTTNNFIFITGGWFGTPFHPNYTKGVIVDTFYYKAAVSTNLKITAKHKSKDEEKSLQWFTVNATMITSSKEGQIFVVPLKVSMSFLVTSQQ